MNAEFLCLCGHPFKEHSITVCDGYEWCNMCYNKYGEKKSEHEFRGDNLRSLEVLSK